MAQIDGQSGSLSPRMFGPQAGVYAESKVHIRDDSLDSVQRLTSPDLLDGDATCGWAVDIGTGAGFTAFAMAEVAQRVVGSDITRPMLEQARRISRERSLANVRTTQNAAESLPFATASVDLITCRVAAHHFRDYGAALGEAQRVLRSGGALVIADSIAPEDDAVAKWMNDIELRRDFSHVENRKISIIRQMLGDRGFDVVGSENERIYLWFNDWVARTKVAKDEVAALFDEFQNATAEVKEAFQVGEPEEDGDFLFSWPCWIFRAIKA